MYKFNKICSAVIVAVVLLALPFYTTFYILPSYGDFVFENSENTMVDLASHIAASLTIHSTISPDTTLPTEFVAEIGHIKKSINLWKVKVFSPEGEIVYSSTPKDIGNMTKKAFFPEIVRSGNFRSRIDKRDIITSGGDSEIMYLLESYVPIIRGGKTIGVFEIYYDLTSALSSVNEQKEQYKKILLLTVFGLIVAAIMRLSNIFITRNNG